ncbi:MAG: hypothetical protein NVSMB18_04270 [Acetobacteraceae bacterium]
MITHRPRGLRHLAAKIVPEAFCRKVGPLLLAGTIGALVPSSGGPTASGPGRGSGSQHADAGGASGVGATGGAARGGDASPSLPGGSSPFRFGMDLQAAQGTSDIVVSRLLMVRPAFTQEAGPDIKLGQGSETAAVKLSELPSLLAFGTMLCVALFVQTWRLRRRFR